MRTLILISFLACLASCSPEKRLAKLVNRHPELVTSDTVYQPIPVIRAEVVRDTVVEFTTDTVTIENERLRVDVVVDTVTKKIYVVGKCKADTVIVRVPVAVNTVRPVLTKIERRPYWYQWVQIYFGKLFIILLIVAGFFLWAARFKPPVK